MQRFPNIYAAFGILNSSEKCSHVWLLKLKRKRKRNIDLSLLKGLQMYNSVSNHGIYYPNPIFHFLRIYYKVLSRM